MNSFKKIFSFGKRSKNPPCEVEEEESVLLLTPSISIRNRLCKETKTFESVDDDPSKIHKYPCYFADHSPSENGMKTYTTSIKELSDRLFKYCREREGKMSAEDEARQKEEEAKARDYCDPEKVRKAFLTLSFLGNGTIENTRFDYLMREFGEQMEPEERCSMMEDLGLLNMGASIHVDDFINLISSNLKSSQKKCITDDDEDIDEEVEEEDEMDEGEEMDEEGEEDEDDDELDSCCRMRISPFPTTSKAISYQPYIPPGTSEDNIKLPFEPSARNDPCLCKKQPNCGM